MQTWSAIFLLVLFSSSSYAQVNRGIGFDGFSQYANLGAFYPDNNFSNGLTIECWVKWNAFNTWSRIVDISNGMNSDNIIVANEANSNQLRYEVYNEGFTQGITSPVWMNTGQWYHIAITHDQSGYAVIYIDGKAVQSGYIPLPANVQRYQAYAGLSPWGGDGLLDAQMDELRIWNNARTASEITSHMWSPVSPTENGLVAMYHFDEAGGNIIQNACPYYGADAFAFLDMGASFQEVPTRAAANAIALDGMNDCINISSPLNHNSSYTKEAWIFLNSTSMAPQNIISSFGSPLWIDGGVLRAGNNSSSFQVADASPLPAFTWVHVAVSYNAATGEMRLYRNGALVGSVTTFMQYQSAVNYIGAWFDGANNTAYLNGMVDEVRIWNEARSNGQILAYMNREIDAATEPALVAYYQFNQGIAGGDNSGLVTLFDAARFHSGTIVGLDFSGGSSNYVQQKNNLVILPVQFGNFTARKIQNDILLQWQTLSEEQAHAFHVEHSTDGTTWVNLGEVSAFGNSTITRQYQYIHLNPSAGVHHYRISQADLNGKKSISEIRTVSVERAAQNFLVSSNIILNGRIDVIASRPVELVLVNTAGMVVWKKQVNAGPVSINTGQLAKGMYFLSDGNITERILVK